MKKRIIIIAIVTSMALSITGCGETSPTTFKETTTKHLVTIDEPSAEETALAKERAQKILNAIALLPEDHRLMIILRDMNGLSYQEMAEIAGITEGTVKSRLSRARISLKKALEQ